MYKKIRKIKDLYKQRKINVRMYKLMLDREHDKLARLELRLSNLDLIPTLY